MSADSASAPKRAGNRSSYRVSDDPTETNTEARRLALLSELRDRRSASVLTTLGIGDGWRCLDVGSGNGSLARWMSQIVHPSGSVVATDVDTRFQSEESDDFEVLQHDIVQDELPSDEFDLVHARAVLQTTEQRDLVLDKLVRATKPGGWVVVSDPDWTGFEQQPMPSAFRALHQGMMGSAIHAHGYDPHWAARIPAAFQERGLVEIDASGESNAMRGGTASAEWLLLAYERSAPGLVRAGLLDQSTVDEGLRAGRAEDFLVMGPVSVYCWGRKP